MVDFILKSLLSKEILYGPLVEIRDKYPAWLLKQKQSIATAIARSKIRDISEEGGTTTRSQSEEGGATARSQSEEGGTTARSQSALISLIDLEDLSRYEQQYESIKRVCVQYETNANDTVKIMELIQAMQAFGDPPSGES